MLSSLIFGSAIGLAALAFISDPAFGQATDTKDEKSAAKSDQEKTKDTRDSAKDAGKADKDSAKDTRDTAKDSAKDTRDTAKDAAKDARDSAKDTEQIGEGCREGHKRCSQKGNTASYPANDARDSARDSAKDTRDSGAIALATHVTPLATLRVTPATRREIAVIPNGIRLAIHVTQRVITATPLATETRGTAAMSHAIAATHATRDARDSRDVTRDLRDARDARDVRDSRTMRDSHVALANRKLPCR